MNKRPRPSEGRLTVSALTVGPMETNCYIVGDRESGEAVVIDPGAEPDRIQSELRKSALKVKCVVNTHGHGDHIGANAALAAPIYIHRLDEDLLADPERNLSSSFSVEIVSPPASRLLEEGDAVDLGGASLKVIHTPGHTPGSICLRLGDILFTGDTLFSGGVGRTDLPYGDERKLMDSIRSKLMKLDDGVMIYPGHGPCSTIGDERESGLFL